MGEGMALGQIGDDDGDKGCKQEVAYDLEADFVGLVPEGADEAFQEFENTPLGHPYEEGVEDAGGKDEFAGGAAMLDLDGRQAGRLGVVCAPDQNDMYEGHASEQRDDVAEHDPIFSK